MLFQTIIQKIQKLNIKKNGNTSTINRNYSKVIAFKEYIIGHKFQI